jgi:hypothetical protein
MSSPSLLQRALEHPVWILAVGLATIVSAVFTILTFYAPGSVNSGSSRAVPQPSASVHQDAKAGPSAADPVVAVGTCLKRPELTSITACTTAHTYEVFSTQDCGDGTLVRYLGGRPGGEVIRARTRKIPSAGRSPVCVVDDPTHEPSLTSARDALKGPGHSGWRLCVDSRVDAEVPCSADHTGEVIPAFVRGGSVDCVSAADTYLGRPAADFGTQLRVETLRRDQGPQCVISALGSDLLNASLRQIGVRSLPLASS